MKGLHTQAPHGCHHTIKEWQNTHTPRIHADKRGKRGGGKGKRKRQKKKEKRKSDEGQDLEGQRSVGSEK